MALGVAMTLEFGLAAAAILPVAGALGVGCARLSERYAALVARGAPVNRHTFFEALQPDGKKGTSPTRAGEGGDGHGETQDVSAAAEAPAGRGACHLMAWAGAVLLMLASLPFLHAPSFLAAAHLAVCTVLLALSFIDLRCRLLPDALTLPLLVAGLLLSGGGWGPPLHVSLAGAAFGYAVLKSVDLVYLLWRGQAGIGGGDMKCLAAVGAWTGWAPLPAILLAACIGGVLMALGARLRGAPAVSVAFGPCLSLPSAAVILSGGDVQYLFI